MREGTKDKLFQLCNCSLKESKSDYILEMGKLCFFNLFTELAVFMFPKVIRNTSSSPATFYSLLLCPHFCVSLKKVKLMGKLFYLRRILFQWL